MAKIKTRALVILIRSLLLYMRTKHLAERPLHQMRCRMVLAGLCAVYRIDAQHCIIADFNHSLCDRANMRNSVSYHIDGILHLKDSIPCRNNTFVADLTAHCRIKRRLCHNYRTRLSICKRICHLVLCCQCRNRHFKRQCIITCKLTCYIFINLFINRCICTHIIGNLTGFTRFFPLFIH